MMILLIKKNPENKIFGIKDIIFLIKN